MDIDEEDNENADNTDNSGKMKMIEMVEKVEKVEVVEMVEVVIFPRDKTIISVDKCWAVRNIVSLLLKITDHTFFLFFSHFLLSLR